MPFISIRYVGILSKKQKATIASKITEIMEKEAGKPKQYTQVVFEEISAESWSMSGNLLG